MRGTLRETRPGVWELRVSAGKGEDGRYKQVSRTLHGTEREAGKALRRLVVEVEAGRVKPWTADGSVEHVFGRWMRRQEQNGASPSTLAGHRSYLRAHILPALGSLPVARLKPSHLHDLYDRMLDRGLSPTTVHHCHAIIRAALHFAVQEDWIERSPAERARPPASRRADITPPNLDEIAKLIHEADEYDPTFGVFLRLAAATGARRGELCALRWSDIDFEKGTVLIARSAVGRLIKSTKSGRARRIALDPGTLDLLREHRERAAKLAAEAEVALGPAAFVFAEEPDGVAHRHPDWATHAFGVVRERAGLPRIRLHDLRHAHVTQLLGAGVPLQVVAGRAGHSSEVVTAGIYSHWLAAGDRAAADAWGGLARGKVAD